MCFFSPQWSQVSSLGLYVVDLFLVTFGRYESRLFLKCLSVHHVECCVILKHQAMFRPITSFVSLVESVPANTCAFCSLTRSQFCIEISSNNGHVSFAICRVFLDRLVHFLDVMVRMSRVREVHTHQFDALAAYHDRGGDGRSLMYSVSIILCLHFLFSICCRIFLLP